MNVLLKPTSLLTGRKLLYTGFIASIVAFTSCNKKDTTPSAVSEANATEAVTEAVAPNSAGLVLQMQGMAAVTTNNSYLAACSLSKDTTVSDTASLGDISWDYNFSWDWTLDCTLQKFTLDFAGLVHYTSSLVISGDSSVATYTATNLASSQLTVNASYKRGGSTQLKDGSLAFYRLITLTSSNIIVDKGTKNIVSGTASVQITGYDNLGKTFSFSGTLVFTGSNTGILTFASGNTANISW